MDHHSTTVTKVIKGCVYIRRRFYAIRLMRGSGDRHSTTVTKVVEGCVYIRMLFYAISLMRGERREQYTFVGFFMQFLS